MRYLLIPGIYPRQVKPILISRSHVQPLSKKTPRGGRTTAKEGIVHTYFLFTQCIGLPKMNLKISEQVRAIICI